MLSVNGVGQNYNTSFGKGNAKELLKTLGKKPFSPQEFDRFALTDPVANAAQRVKAGLGSEAELYETATREIVGKMTFGNFVKSLINNKHINK